MQHWTLIFFIGPVQDFIASARRCQDLWFGSWLLSDLSSAVAAATRTAAHDRNFGDDALVFPARVKESDGDSREVSVSNKVMLHSSRALSQEDIQFVVNAGLQALNGRLQQLAREALDRVGRDRLHIQRFDAQISDLIEFLWVAAAAATYKESRSKAEALLADRKNTRSYSQPTWAVPGVPKSSLDGVRESVLLSKLKSKDAPGILRLRSDEQLCAVGVLKRAGRENVSSVVGGEARTVQQMLPVFHSTSHMASASARAALGANPDAQRDLLDWLDTLPEKVQRNFGLIRSGATADFWTFKPLWGDFPPLRLWRTLPLRTGETHFGLDGALLYPNRLADSFSEAGVHEEDAAAPARELQKILSSHGIGTPFPYYAMLLADGDRMGAAIDEMTCAAAHRRLSLALDQEFASQCAVIVEEHGGSLIYSGGDDVLALLPVMSVVQCADALRVRFFDTMSRALANLPDVAVPTLSIGVAIVHHLEPLDNVRELAKAAEGEAKRTRNSLAIILDKRGAAPRMVSGRWPVDTEGVPGRATSLKERLFQWAKLLQVSELPGGTAALITQSISVLRPFHSDSKTASNDKDGAGDLSRILRSLVVRVFERRRSLSPEQRSLLETLLLELFEDAADSGTETLFSAIDRLVDELDIAKTILESIAQAQSARVTLKCTEEVNP